MLALPYGRVPYPRDQGRRATVLAPLPMPAPRDPAIIDATRPSSRPPAATTAPGPADGHLGHRRGRNAQHLRSMAPRLAHPPCSTCLTVLIATRPHRPNRIPYLDLWFVPRGAHLFTRYLPHVTFPLVLHVRSPGPPIRVHRDVSALDPGTATRRRGAARTARAYPDRLRGARFVAGDHTIIIIDADEPIGPVIPTGLAMFRAGVQRRRSRRGVFTTVTSRRSQTVGIPRARYARSVDELIGPGDPLVDLGVSQLRRAAGA
jgi:hypothetical protein